MNGARVIYNDMDTSSPLISTSKSTHTWLPSTTTWSSSTCNCTST